jgi:predicted RNase H-like HicB family nuclease
MRFLKFEIVIEKEPKDGAYSAYSPSLPGCFSNGRTVEDAKRNMREAIQQHIAALPAHGEPVPQNDRLVHVEELSIGIPRWCACRRSRRVSSCVSCSR